MSEEEKISGLVHKISISDCENSFRRFFDHFYPRLFELALYYTKNQNLAEEVVSDVFLKVWRQRKHLTTIKNIKAYLFVAIQRQSLNGRRNTQIFPVFTHGLEYHIIIESRTPENILFTEEMLKAIEHAVQNLPERCRLVYKLVKEEQLKYKEVARLLNISEKTVEMHIGNALKRIREDLASLETESRHLNSVIKSAFLALLALLFS
jgi:RNA polymerase sigma-70 factor (ECF subfamily)